MRKCVPPNRTHVILREHVSFVGRYVLNIVPSITVPHDLTTFNDLRTILPIFSLSFFFPDLSPIELEYEKRQIWMECRVLLFPVFFFSFHVSLIVERTKAETRSYTSSTLDGKSISMRTYERS